MGRDRESLERVLGNATSPPRNFGTGSRECPFYRVNRRSRFGLRPREELAGAAARAVQAADIADRVLEAAEDQDPAVLELRHRVAEARGVEAEVADRALAVRRLAGDARNDVVVRVELHAARDERVTLERRGDVTLTGLVEVARADEAVARRVELDRADRHGAVRAAD